MTWEALAAVAALVTLALSILGALGVLIWHAGRHSQRLDSAETDIKELKKVQDEHTKAINVWDQALKLLEEVRHDVKNLVTGKILPGRRRAAD